MYKLKPLPFNYQDIEPYIDTHTIGLHYHKHQQNYMNKLNTLLEKNNYDFIIPPEELYKRLNQFQDNELYSLIFNLGGVVNHDLYWQTINPYQKQEPLGELNTAIIEKFGSYSKFKEKFIDSALSLQGAGYTFLVKDKNKNLMIINTLNQDSPLLLGYIPLLNIDMWEHAYYLTYKNNKQEYINNFFEIINFSYANKIYNNIENTN